MPHEHHRHRSRSRSRSPHRSDRKSKHRTRSTHHKTPLIQRPLPLGAHEISRHDLPTYRPMFALYLDIQKQLDIDDLDEHELKGRWKSFVGKWYDNESPLPGIAQSSRWNGTDMAGIVESSRKDGTTDRRLKKPQNLLPLRPTMHRLSPARRRNAR